MKKLTVLCCLWFVCCNAIGLWSGHIDDNHDYIPDSAGEHVIVTVYGTTAKFKAIAADTGTKFQVIYGTSATSLTGYTDIDTSSASGEVLTVSKAGLTAGQKYYYKAVYGSGEAADQITTGRVEVTPEDTIVRYFTIPPATTASTYSFKFIIVSDAHLDMLPYYHVPGQIKTQLQTISAGIKANSPDFVVFSGDDIQSEDAVGEVLDEDDATAVEILEYDYGSFLLALADIGIPTYFAIGNHEVSFGSWASQCQKYATCNDYDGQCPCAESDDAAACAVKTGLLDTFETGGTGFLYHRNKYLLSPTAPGSVDGSYSYVDWGGARLFFLDPYRYKTATSQTTQDCPYSLGQTQAAWFRNAVRFHSGQWVFTIIHQALKQKATPGARETSCTDFTYGWGGVDDGTNVWANQGCNEWQLYRPLKHSVASRFLFLGHSHYYWRESWKNMYVYGLPAPFRTAEDSATESANYYTNSTYYGWREEEPWAEPGNHTTGGVAMLLVTVTEKTVTVYGLKADGTRHTGVPIDTYSRKAGLL